MSPNLPGCTFLLIGRHNLSSGYTILSLGYTIFHRVTQFYHQVTQFFIGFFIGFCDFSTRSYICNLHIWCPLFLICYLLGIMYFLDRKTYFAKHEQEPEPLWIKLGAGAATKVPAPQHWEKPRVSAPCQNPSSQSRRPRGWCGRWSR